MRKQIIPGVLLLLLAATVQPVGADVMPDGYRIEKFSTSVSDPEAAALAPDGRIFVLEKVTGSVRVIDDGLLLATPFVTVPVATNAGTSETGLLGIALHPDFLKNGWVYLYYTHDLGGGSSTNRIVRYTALGNTGTDPLVLLDNIGVGTNGEDNGGSLTFGPDGMLYASVGVMEDDASADDLASLGGKILRMDPEDGSAPPDNPQTGLSHPYDLIWAWGFRNTASIAFDEATGTLYATDNYDDEAGVDCDEINVVVDNLDYGWDTLSCGTQGFPPSPMQVINPQNTAWGLAPYTGSAYPGTCSNDGNLNCLTGDDCKTCDGTSTPCVSNESCSTCSNFPTQTCTSGADCKACDDDSSVPCSVNQDCYECSKDPGVRCQYDHECPSGGSKCNVFNTCIDYSCDPGSCVTNDCDGATSAMFVAGGSTGIMRDKLTGVDEDQLESSMDFYVPTGSCPTSVSSLAQGDDGWVYATATGGDGLYRVLYDDTDGPREVSATPYAPLTLAKDGSGLRFRWEDIKQDAWGCSEGRSYCSDEILTFCNDSAECVGTCEPRPCPTGADTTVYTLWSGTLTSPFTYGHSVMVETKGAPDGDALVTHLETSMPTGDRYFLVSARGDNREGTTGYDSDMAERTGYGTTDKCADIGYGSSRRDYEYCFGEFPKAYADQHNQMWTMADLRGQPLIISMMQYG